METGFRIALPDVAHVSLQGETLWGFTEGELRRYSFPDGKVLASAKKKYAKQVVTAEGVGFVATSFKKIIEVIDPVTLKKTGSLAGHKDQVGAIALSPNGRILASVGHDRTARLWDVATLEAIRVMTYDKPNTPNPNQPMETLRFVNEGRWLVTVASDSFPRPTIVWDVATGERVAALELDPAEVFESADGVYFRQAADWSGREFDAADDSTAYLDFATGTLSRDVKLPPRLVVHTIDRWGLHLVEVRQSNGEPYACIGPLTHEARGLALSNSRAMLAEVAVEGDEAAIYATIGEELVGWSLADLANDPDRLREASRVFALVWPKGGDDGVYAELAALVGQPEAAVRDQIAQFNCVALDDRTLADAVARRGEQDDLTVAIYP